MTRPFLPLLVERQMGETQLFVTDVKIEGKHHIVCRNEAEAEKSRKDREAIVAALDAQLKKGDKALVGNSAYRRYLRKTPEMKHRSAFEIDPGKLTQEARFDGIFVVRTNANTKSRYPRPTCGVAAGLVTAVHVFDLTHTFDVIVPAQSRVI
jgi:hypothetical protein